jgi:hypothetical protein
MEHTLRATKKGARFAPPSFCPAVRASPFFFYDVHEREAFFEVVEQLSSGFCCVELEDFEFAT